MGQEISSHHFTERDFRLFDRRVEQETALLSRWFHEQRFPDLPLMGGLEVEAWLIDRELQPSPINRAFIEAADDPLIVPELARFNFEINTLPQALADNALSAMEAELAQRWKHCVAVAETLDALPVQIGILPSVRDDQLSLVNMSDQERYRALNEQVLRARRGRPLKLHISGRDTLDSVHYDVMLEAAATSFQIHLRVPVGQAAAYYNASIMVSALMVAASANSPYLFNRDLWCETRIPLFEQAVASPTRPGCERFGGRVGFGQCYAKQDLHECFTENLRCFEALLPMEMDKYPASLSHLRLHNGTIWRWNRPLIGFEDDGSPHLRIEHRSVAAGPTVSDAIANAALYYGLVFHVKSLIDDAESQLPFAVARDNFYRAARSGLDTEIQWHGGRRVSMRRLLLDELLPAAKRALLAQGLAEKDAQHYLGIIEARVQSRRTGSWWQRQVVAREGDMHGLLDRYVQGQRSGAPVHEWALD